MEWFAIVLSSSMTVLHAQPCVTSEDAETALVEFKKKTAYGFGTQFIIARVHFALLT